jgi:Na+/alanine symporter
MRRRRHIAHWRNIADDLIVTTILVLFAFSTVIGWSSYGETGVVYVLGARAASRTEYSGLSSSTLAPRARRI